MEKIDRLFKSESFDLAFCNEDEVMAYCEATNNDDAHARWITLQEELAFLLAEARAEFCR